MRASGYSKKQLNLLIAVSIETHVSLRDYTRRGLSKKSTTIIDDLFLCKCVNILERNPKPIFILINKIPH